MPQSIQSRISRFCQRIHTRLLLDILHFTLIWAGLLTAYHLFVE